MTTSSGTQLSTLIALARLRGTAPEGQELDQETLVDSLSSPWAKHLAKAILTGSDAELQLEEKQDFEMVRKLAGVPVSVR